MASSLEAYRRAMVGNTLMAYPMAFHDACQAARKGRRLDNAELRNLNADIDAHRLPLSSCGHTNH
jgi:hypothetical protein